MLRLTLELSGDSMRRTPTVAVAANGAKDFFYPAKKLPPAVAEVAAKSFA